MAASTYLNLDTLQMPNNSETSTFHELAITPQNNHHHLFPYSNETTFFSNPFFDNYLDPTGGFLFSEEEDMYPYHHNQLFPFTSYDPFTSLCHYSFPIQEEYCNLLPCPKRQKCCYEEQEQLYLHSSLESLQELTPPPHSFIDGFVVPNYDNNSASLEAEELPLELFCSVPDFKVPQHGTHYVDDGVIQCEKKSNERTISPQSIAARERRRKITVKTQELGKLVPGGPKMNTAEMLHAASKYVKYLQAQVQMLQLINTYEEDKEGPSSENLHALVVSPCVQEKLYTEERCLVPKEFVPTLTNNEEVQSRPTILKDLKQLIRTDIEKKPKQH
ncbi:hypothetical protein RJT34_27121 [Clitoria ternatea]|uniref:BHLH domain-containing protein n=1 Tax=Clitoria ternatea TaxID=43366 RepID=A0AAN9F9U3_CLITE